MKVGQLNWAAGLEKRQIWQKSADVKWIVPPVTVSFLLRYGEDGGWGCPPPTGLWQKPWTSDKGILKQVQDMVRCPTRDMSHPWHFSKITMHFSMYFRRSKISWTTLTPLSHCPLGTSSATFFLEISTLIFAIFWGLVVQILRYWPRHGQSF